MTFSRDVAQGAEDGHAGRGGPAMLRATVWTMGLFGVGTAISRLYPATWTEPLVLLGLGIALLFASARTARVTPPPARARAPVTDVSPVTASVATAKATAPAVAAAAAAAVQATVQVERTA
jgi:hypothetical protein